MTEKTELRRKIRAWRRSLSKDEKQKLDKALLQNVFAHPWIKEADTVLLYCSLPEEPDTQGILERLLLEGIPVALPVCLESGIMQFYLLHCKDELQIGNYYNIPEPIGRDEPILTEKTVCIVPALAFTPNGERLGQGGGYYDRFLGQYPELRTIGITYHAILQENLPCENHDIPVKVVITDESWR
ncbi:MAG: 5-formyltetrahydrofolate cyclo-ligase [Oscillospiraceae bacterium]